MTFAFLRRAFFLPRRGAPNHQIGLGVAQKGWIGLRRPGYIDKNVAGRFLAFGVVKLEKTMNDTFEVLIKRISPTLKRITYRLNGHYTFFNDEDLFQEALIRLWEGFREGKLADKTDSYILQGCYFHLKNYIRKNYNKAFMVSLEQGRSGDDNADSGEILHLKGADSPFEEVHCNMVVEQIMNNGLTAREKEVFTLALEGLTAREIGGRLGISHVRVVKLRGRIKEKCSKHLDRQLF